MWTILNHLWRRRRKSTKPPIYVLIIGDLRFYFRRVRFVKKLLCGLLFLYCGIVNAAKVQVSLTTPSQNEDGSSLTNLAAIVVEWGSCNGNNFGTRQAGMTIAETRTNYRLSTSIYPTGLTKVCVRAFAINTEQVSSVSSNTAWKNLLPGLGQPKVFSFIIEEKQDGEVS